MRKAILPLWALLMLPDYRLQNRLYSSLLHVKGAHIK